MELFDFKDILYREEYLSRLITEFFYHSFTNIADLHKRAMENLRKEVIAVADKWLAKIQQMTIDELRDAGFLERVKRSATYFEQEGCILECRLLPVKQDHRGQQLDYPGQPDLRRCKRDTSDTFCSA